MKRSEVMVGLALGGVVAVVSVVRLVVEVPAEIVFAVAVAVIVVSVVMLRRVLAT